MKTNRALSAISLILIFFFLGQASAEIYFLVGPKHGLEKKFPEPFFDLKGLSLSSRLHTETAYAWLQADTSSASDPTIKKSMNLLLKALRRNPLDYQARYYLAKAYLRFSAMDNDYFDLGVRELKRAARIRGSNKQIAIDCGKIFFSLWPFIEADDKAFTASLLNGVMPMMSWPEFSPLVEMWSLYVQDTAVLMDLLKEKPEFFGPVANQLVAVAIPIKQRHELLALHEVYTLDVVERRSNELNLQGQISLDSARSLLSMLRQGKGYYRFYQQSALNLEKQANMQRSLLLRVISGTLAEFQAEPDPVTLQKIRETVLTYITDHSGITDLDDLQKLLQENDYFKENDFSSLYLKTRIAFHKGNYSDIIAEIESLRTTISFVKKEQLADYTNILLLLVDSYYSSKLLTAAEAVARDLYQNQPDNPDVLYRVLHVQKILGDEGAPDLELNEKLATVENSRLVTVGKTKSDFDVFLFNKPEIEVVFEPVWLAQFKPKQLLQVFVDGRIAFENYVDAVPEKIVIGPPFAGIESKVRVQVNVL